MSHFKNKFDFPLNKIYDNYLEIKEKGREGVSVIHPALKNGLIISVHLYVENVDAIHKQAVENGAIVYFEPEDMPYNDRQSGIIDPSGNYWWISKRLKQADYEV